MSPIDTDFKHKIFIKSQEIKLCELLTSLNAISEIDGNVQN